jgi:Flp pilus assembly protein TadG
MVDFRVRDHGQAVLLMLAVIVCSGLLAIAVGGLGATLRDRQQAQNAADAAALAGVEGGRDAADELARENGAVLVGFDRAPASGGSWTVLVTVRVGAVTARARATNGP